MRVIMVATLVALAACSPKSADDRNDTADGHEIALPPRGARWTVSTTVLRGAPDSTSATMETLGGQTKVLAGTEAKDGWVAVYHPRPTYDTLGFVQQGELTDQQPPFRVAGRLIRIGDAFHVTGCENGRLELSVVNLWESSDFRRVIGRLSGDGRADQGLSCQGAVVTLRNVVERDRRQILQVQSVVNGTVGWFTDSFVGRAFPRERCRDLFAGDAAAIGRCQGQ